MSTQIPWCADIPAVVTEEYKAKGEFKEIGELKSYITGPADAKKGILFLFDVFAYSPQALQGADIIANSGDKDHKYLVFVPDYFDGQTAASYYNAQSDEEKDKLRKEFFSGPASIETNVKRLSNYFKSAQAHYPEVTSWGAIGFCWGGRTLLWLSTVEGTPLKAIVQAHPSLEDPDKVGKSVRVPLLTLASKDENWENVQKLTKLAPAGSEEEHYDKSFHGWMGARADLKEKDQEETYIQGYKQALEFFAKHV